jgi:heterodisulfide reductase subunit A
MEGKIVNKQAIVIIGGGIAGLSGALSAAAQGCQVYLVEKSDHLGGRAIDYCCKATEQCNKCSACLVGQHVLQVKNNKNITVLLKSQVSKVEGGTGDYSIQVNTPEGAQKVNAQAIIVATGFKPFDTSLRSELGHGWQKGVITALELEQAIKEKGSLTAAFGNLQSIGFVQCVGSRDLALGNEYCSKVCCMYATRLSRLIRQELPEAEISIFYMDLQTFGKGFDKYMAETKNNDKIRFVRGIPSKVFKFPYDRLTVRYGDSSGEPTEAAMDLLVLSTAITPGEDNNQLADILQIKQDRFGFFSGNSIEPIESGRTGIYLAGTCQSPKDIQESLAQGKAAVSRAFREVFTGSSVL